MYFIGVHTETSMIMRVFPPWAEALGLGNCELVGIDLALHDAPERYRQVVRFIKEDPLSVGALVTTHKIDLLHAAKDLFDNLDELAALMGEVSAISKSGGRLVGTAKDPISAGGALEAFLPPGHWEHARADAFLMGAGGSSIALSWYLAHPNRGNNRPARIFVSNRSPGRLEEMKKIHASHGIQVPIEYVLTPRPEDNDAVLSRLAPGSLVANATGLGKDAPGSPLSDAAAFPRMAMAWDFNYRGQLEFLRQARAQKASRELRVEDGWVYFVIGWLAVIGEVFAKDIPLHGPVFDGLRHIAESERR
jgi:shikimate 5-dehydrogenase